MIKTWEKSSLGCNCATSYCQAVRVISGKVSFFSLKKENRLWSLHHLLLLNKPPTQAKSGWPQSIQINRRDKSFVHIFAIQPSGEKFKAKLYIFKIMLNAHISWSEFHSTNNKRVSRTRYCYGKKILRRTSKRLAEQLGWPSSSSINGSYTALPSKRLKWCVDLWWPAKNITRSCSPRPWEARASPRTTWCVCVCVYGPLTYRGTQGSNCSRDIPPCIVVRRTVSLAEFV